MALFDLGPKESTGDLFGREREVAELARLVGARRWVAVLGPRMVGKTSLAKAVRARLKLPGAYVNLWGVRSVRGLLSALVQGLNESRSLLARLRGAAGRIEGVTLGPVGFTLSGPGAPVTAVTELFELLGRETKQCLVVLDEVQELAPNSGVLLKLLGRVFNTYPNLTFVFTGSLFGLTRALLEPSVTSPLLGRSPVAMRLGPFDRATALEFLRRGTRESGARVAEEELVRAVEGPLDGTPGWLTLFGNHLAVRGLPPARALAETVAEGKRVAADELAHFLEGRERRLYWPALKAGAVGASWSVVQEYMARETGGEVNHGTVGRVLNGLEAASILGKVSGSYRVADPMMRAYVLESGRAPPRPHDLAGSGGRRRP